MSILSKNFPRQIKVGGYVYDCRLAPNMVRDDNWWGATCSTTREIVVDSSLPHQNQASTLLHEIIEAINRIYALGLEHNQILVLEAALYQVMVDNPQVFTDFIMATEKEDDNNANT